MFAGIVRTGSAPIGVDPSALLAVLCPFDRGDAEGTLVTDRLTVVQTRLQITQESRTERLPYVDESTGVVVLSWARIDNRDDLAAHFGWSAEHRRDATEPEYIAAAWETWRTDAANRLEGDFAFAVWDPRSGELYAARDAMGVRPLFYATGTDVFAIATSANVFPSIPGIDASPSPIWMARYLASTSTDFEETALRDVRRVRAGHWLLMKDGSVRTEQFQYFDPESPDEGSRDPMWLTSYREMFLQAVRDRLRADDPIGAELSGGLDSSTIVAAIVAVRPEAISTMHTFGFAHAEQEPEYILETSRGLMIVNNHVHAGAIPESNQRRGWQAVGYPIEHGNSIGHITFYTLARMFGVKVLFSGHGGDEGVTNNAREALDEMIAARQWDLAMRTIGGRRSLQPLRLFKRTQEQRPDPNQGLRDAIVGRLKWSVLKPDVFDEVGVEGRVRAGAAMHDVKPRVNDLALARLLAPHSPIRTSDGSLVAASYGLQYEWPLLDRRLIQQWLSTPTAWKQAEGYGRYLHRAASAPFTPRKVVWKPSKDMTGGQGPDYVPDLEETRASWRDTRERMPAEVADLIDVDKVDRMVEDGQEEAGLPLRRGVKGATVLTDWLADR